MLRLFAVRLENGQLLTDAVGFTRYFEHKMDAKKARDKHPGAVVVLGPDHDRA